MDNEYWYDIDMRKGNSIKRLLAISIGEFRSDTLSTLPSAAIDRERVVRTFSKLNFRPTQEKAGILTKSDGRKLIMKFREKFAKDKAKTKVLVIYLKSHGGLHHTRGTMIHFSDEAIALWDLLDPLLQLEQLEGVPKMIIFEACRGEMSQFIPAGNSLPFSQSTVLHRRMDTILFAASPEAEKSFTPVANEEVSPFTESLCRSLLEDKSQDVFDLGININKQLKHFFPTVYYEDGTVIAHKLAPVMESCLTKHLRLLLPAELDD